MQQEEGGRQTDRQKYRDENVRLHLCMKISASMLKDGDDNLKLDRLSSIVSQLDVKIKDEITLP